MTSARLHDSETGKGIDAVETLVWAVLAGAGLAVVVWAAAKLLA